MSHPTRSSWIATVLFVLAASGCQTNKRVEPPQSFASDWAGTMGGPRGSYESGAKNGDAGVGGSVDNPQRTIAEADIVALDGDRLYALSRWAGLSVIDLADPDQPKLLGRYRDTHEAQPFEMYVREGVAFVLLSGWGQYNAKDDGTGYEWVQTSKVLAIDTADPNAMTVVGVFDVPGAISDSRLVGDVLYVVGYQDGTCFGCSKAQPRTSVVSLDVSDVRSLAKVDELFFDDEQNQWGWSRRSISVTAQRMYVAGIDYGSSGPVGSQIQIVDISDPAGALVLGATLRAEGQIASRWQMDETDGVLRVISQAPPWNMSEAPVLQTFRVTSSQDVAPLGRLALVLPRPEMLQSVRFDGARGYAITSERTDPLFTLDLSDPEKPKQVGQLEIPGWIYYLEPRGDRVYGLGFDPSSPDGALTVSLFDVSTLAHPTMLSRVNFGGDWGYLPEDQDRIHKVFRVLDEQGLVLVPYSGYAKAQVGTCQTYGSGVQLVQIVNDGLRLRGSAPARGEVRRAFMHDDRLVAMSDERIESFDLADLDAPDRTATLVLAQSVNRAIALEGGTVARLSTDWWSSTPTVDFVPLEHVGDASAATAQLDLAQALGTDDVACARYTYVDGAFALGTRLVLTYRQERWSETVNEAKSGVLVIEGEDASHPRVLSKIDWTSDWSWWRYDGFYGYGLPVNQQAVAHTAKALALMEATYVTQGERSVTRNKLRVVDLSNLEHLTQHVMDLPQVDGYSGLLADGDRFFTSHYEPIEGDTTRVRFYVDRFDVSKPSAPMQLDSINVPGALLAYDSEARRVVTLELRRQVIVDQTWAQCDERFAHFEFASNDQTSDWQARRGTCTGYRAALHLLALQGDGVDLLDSYFVPEDRTLSSTSLGDGMLFAVLSSGSWGYYAAEGGGSGVASGGSTSSGKSSAATVSSGDVAVGSCYYGGCYYGSSEPSELLVLGGLRGPAFEPGVLDAGDLSDTWWGYWGGPGVYAAGKKALLIGNGEAAVVDASSPAKPELARTVELAGGVSHVSVSGNTALLSLGMYGAQRIDL